MYITDVIRADMLKHARTSYPKECCGFIVGYRTAGEDGSTQAKGRYYVDCDLTLEPHCRWRFLVNPDIYQQVAGEAQELGLEIISIVHSHPNHSDFPSQDDRQHAMVGLSYIIISVCDGRVHSYNAWRLPDLNGVFEQQAIVRVE